MLLKRYCAVLVLCLVQVFVISHLSMAGKSLKFAVVSDHRDRFDELEKALDFIDSEDLDLLFVPGDFYANSYYDHYLRHGFSSNPDETDNFKKVIFVLGNHDLPPLGDQVFQTDIAPFYPQNGPEGAPEGTIFSFDAGECHFVITNQYWGYPQGGYTNEQLEWVTKNLAETTLPLKFVIGHEPAFPLGRHIGNSLDIDPAMRDSFWEMLMHHGVTAYFCGHTHKPSIINKNGVYQCDAGAARDQNISVTIVEADADNTRIRIYDIEDSMPPFTISCVYDTVLDSTTVAEEEPGDENIGVDDYEICFEGPGQPAEQSSCFISGVMSKLNKGINF